MWTDSQLSIETLYIRVMQMNSNWFYFGGASPDDNTESVVSHSSICGVSITHITTESFFRIIANNNEQHAWIYLQLIIMF